MKTHYDYIIIGAGPAGMAAAVTAVRLGLTVLVLDENPAPGGQIFRAVEKFRGQSGSMFERESLDGKALVNDFRRSGVDCICPATVWQVDSDLSVCYSKNGKSVRITGNQILIATGAMERPVPVTGWTLPGVMSAGAADILYKTSGLLPSGNVILAGNGPLLILTACRFMEAGVSVRAILDTSSWKNMAGALFYLPGAMRASGYLAKGLLMKWKIFLSRIKTWRNARNIEINGKDQVESVSFLSRGKKHRLMADTVFLHEGIISNTQLTRQIGCAHEWDAIQRYWRPKLNSWFETDINGISVAGDTGGVFGAKSARIEGELAAFNAACCLKMISPETRNRLTSSRRRELSRESSVRPFMDHLFRPDPTGLIPENKNTTICRCEEVKLREIVDAVNRGCQTPNQVKQYTRCGMGRCQGRMCGPAVSEIISGTGNTDIEAAGTFRIRPPLKPIPLKEIADMRIDS